MLRKELCEFCVLFEHVLFADFLRKIQNKTKELRALTLRSCVPFVYLFYIVGQDNFVSSVLVAFLIMRFTIFDSVNSLVTAFIITSIVICPQEVNIT
jgi:hypothetical protein